jgi:hypothetical protein
MKRGLLGVHFDSILRYRCAVPGTRREQAPLFNRAPATAAILVGVPLPVSQCTINICMAIPAKSAKNSLIERSRFAEFSDQS